MLTIAIDVESIGMHGEGFAVAYVVHNATGVEIDAGCIACNTAAAKGGDDDRAWVAQHVTLPDCTERCANPRQVRAAFWQRWLRWRETGAQLVADIAWPVEARFLAACVDDAGAAAHWQGPFPLLDVATLLVATGIDPTTPQPRRASELPMHNPLADARHCARLWFEHAGAG